jgi:hypothetical protein
VKNISLMSYRRPFGMTTALCLAVLALGLTRPGSTQAAYNTLVNTYDWSHWNNAYPWGDHHNGSAIMLQAQVALSGSSMTLHAQPTSTNAGYRFKSGTIWCKSIVQVDTSHINWTIDGQFKCSTAPGCWPAMWLDGTQTWPPESDIMEFKGNTTCWQNTFRTSSDVSTKTTVVTDPLGTWHHYKAWINRVDATNVTIDYYIDGVWTDRHTANFSGKPMWLIIDFQTEGSSGTATWTDKWMYGGTIEVGYSSP